MSKSSVQHTSSAEPESVVDQVNELRHQFTDGYHELEETYRTTRDQVYALNQKAVTYVKAHPAVCITGAFAVGFVIGKLAHKRWLT